MIALHDFSNASKKRKWFYKCRTCQRIENEALNYLRVMSNNLEVSAFYLALLSIADVRLYTVIGLGVDSSSNTNEHQGFSWGGS